MEAEAPTSGKREGSKELTALSATSSKHGKHRNSDQTIKKSSIFKGVGWNSSKQAFTVSIFADGKTRHVNGVWDDDRDAARAHDAYVLQNPEWNKETNVELLEATANEGNDKDKAEAKGDDVATNGPNGPVEPNGPSGSNADMDGGNAADEGSRTGPGAPTMAMMYVCVLRTPYAHSGTFE